LEGVANASLRVEDIGGVKRETGGVVEESTAAAVEGGRISPVGTNTLVAMNLALFVFPKPTSRDGTAAHVAPCTFSIVDLETMRPSANMLLPIRMFDWTRTNVAATRGHIRCGNFFC
jgi:hypothetical protein